MGRDLHQHDDRHFLVPSDAELPAGDFELTRIDGVKRRVEESSVADFEVSLEEARAFHQHALADAQQRIGVAMGAVGMLLQAARTGSVDADAPSSVDATLGLQGLDPATGEGTEGVQDAIKGLQRLVHLAQTDPEALRRLARQVGELGDDAGVKALMEALPEALREGLDESG